MTRTIVTVALFALGVSAPLSVAQADDKKLLTQKEFEAHAEEWEAHETRVKRVKAYKKKVQAYYKKRGWRPAKGQPPAIGVPELDGQSSQGALALTAGGLLVILGRRRRRDARQAA